MLLWIVWSLLVLAATSGVDGQTIDSAKIAQAKPYVDASNANWCEAHRIGDARLLASLFVEDGALLTRDGKVWQGREAIDSLFRGIFGKYGTADMTITTIDFWVIDSLAYEYGRYTQKLHSPPDGDTTTTVGMYFEIWQQRSDGTWKILRDAGIDPNRGN
jgi:uncharacterized protein (TIGR02246 family)